MNDRIEDAADDEDEIRELWEETLEEGDDDSEEAFQEYWEERQSHGPDDEG